MIDKKVCVICGCKFIQTEDNKTKCISCHKLYPHANSRLELIKRETPKEKNLKEEAIRSVVYEILEEAGLKRKPCQNCGDLFFPKSPAAKNCSKCRTAESN